ncbi:13398_t:CDS:2, partial [Ambispora gerdemannii]
RNESTSHPILQEQFLNIKRERLLLLKGLNLFPLHCPTIFLVGISILDFLLGLILLIICLNWYGTRDSNPQHPKVPGPKPGVSSHSTNPALLVSCGGIEPPTFCLKGKHSTADANFMAGVAGIEPTIKESKSFALPLGYTPKVIASFL